MKEFIKENFGVVLAVVTSVALVGIVSVIVATGGTADKAVNSTFDAAVDRLEAELEFDGE